MKSPSEYHREYVPVESMFTSFERKQSRKFLLNFLDTYFLPICFLSNKLEIKATRIFSNLFDYIYVGSLQLGAYKNITLRSSGLQDGGKVVWTAFSQYYEKTGRELGNYLSICNLIRIAESDLTPFCEKPKLFKYDGELEYDLPGIGIRASEYGKQLRKHRPIHSDSLINEYLVYLIGFDFKAIGNDRILLAILRTKYHQKVH